VKQQKSNRGDTMWKEISVFINKWDDIISNANDKLHEKGVALEKTVLNGKSVIEHKDELIQKAKERWKKNQDQS
jgi:hypothetical protein